MVDSKKIRYLKFVPFVKFDKWYVSYYTNPHMIKSNFKLETLSKLIVPIKEKIKKKDYKGDFSIISKISFADGKIHLRSENETGMDLYKLKLNDILVSKINFHQGAVSINDIGDLVCSTHYQPYVINDKKVIAEYLILVIRSNGFKNFLSFLRADGIKNEATYEFIGKLEIPLPIIEKQKEIIGRYNSKILLAEKQKKHADILETEIEKYLFNVLGIEKMILKPFIKGSLNVFKFSEILDRWDYNKGSSSVFSILHESKYPVKTLGDAFNFISRGWNKKTYNNKTFTYVEMGGIDAGLGIVETNVVEVAKAPSRATQTILAGDLIIGTTRPYLKKFAIVNEDNHNNIASSAFQIIAPSDEYCLDYLLEYLKSEFGVKQFEYYMTGALYPAITSKDLRKVLIPFPPLEVQKQISNYINSLKLKIKELNILSTQNRESAIVEFEKEIFN